jgi:RNA polymerase sigma-70 factor, ECF subfamily
MNTTIAVQRKESALGAVIGRRQEAAARQSGDVDLINRIAKGDRLAMRALFARHNVYVYRFVLRLVGDEALADDLVSEVFIDVWRNAGRFEGRSQVSTWIMAIARFKALSALRRRKDDELDDAEAATIPDTADDPEIAIQKKDTLAILRACMSHLSRDHREIIDLVYFHEKTVEEAAEIVGVPENTAKTRMFHARKRMSQLLQQAGIDRTYQ